MIAHTGEFLVLRVIHRLQAIQEFADFPKQRIASPVSIANFVGDSERLESVLAIPGVIHERVPVNRVVENKNNEEREHGDEKSGSLNRRLFGKPCGQPTKLGGKEIHSGLRR